jgi:hypothetical protein
MDEVQPKFRMFSLGISEFEVYFTELQTAIGIALIKNKERATTAQP